MVILTCQLIGNAVLAMIDPDRFRRGGSDFKSPSNLDKCQQCGASVSQNTNRLVDAVSEEKHEALLNLLEASDLPTLSRAVAKVLTACITSATGCAVYFKPLDASLHEDQLEVFIGEREHVRLHPDNGSSIIWDAYYHGRTVCVNGWLVPESLFTIIRSNSWGYVRQETKVSCLPVQKDANSPVHAVLVVSHNEEWNQYDIWELSRLSKQLSACYSHIQRAFQGRGSRRTEESCSQALMKLCGDLYDQDAGQLQLKVIKYLEEQTRSEVAFLVLVVPDTQELFCQVQGDQILEEEVRFPNSYFAAALETKRPIYLEDVPVEAQKEIEDLVHRPLNSLLCVPVTSKSSDQLIALACLINKKDGNKFTSDDITCIQQSFCYTSSVLTSTLAFQNERKLKNQTQAMLKVARHLFTNLGEFLSQCIHGDYDTFPRIHSMGCEIPISGTGIAGCIEVNKLKQINHSVILKRKSQSSSKRVSKELDKSFNRSHHSIKTLTSEIQRVYEEDQRRKSQVDFLSTDMGSAELKEKQDSQIKSRSNEIVTQKCDHIEEDIHAAKIPKAEMDVLNPVSDSPCLTSEIAVLNPVSDSTCLTSEMDPSTHIADPGSSQPGEKSSTTRLYTGRPSGVNTVGLDDDLEFSGSEMDSTFNSVAEDMEEHLSTKTDDADDLEKYFDAWSPLNSEMKSKGSYSDTAMIQNTSESIQDTSQSSVSMGLIESKCRLSKSDPSLNAILSSCSTDMKTRLNTAFLAGKSDPSVSVAVWQTSKGLSTSGTSQQDSQVTVVDVTDSGWQNRIRHKSTPISFSHSLQGLSMVAAQSDQQKRTVHQYTSHIGSESEPEVLMSESLTMFRRIQFPVGDDYLWNERDLTKLLREVMQQARNLTQAERCSVFLIENETEELVAKVFDGITTNDEVQTEIRMPVTQGIAGHVATTGELLNIKDAYSHHLFYRGIDESTGFRTRNILCFPIKDENDVVLGVAQLCNKKTGPFFTAFDEEVATAFGIYCCIAISHSLMYTKVQEAQHRNKLANELMIYHMQVSDDDMKTLARSEIPTPKKIDPDFDKFIYPPRVVPEFETLKNSISIVEDLGFISRWRIRKETLVRFLMMVKRGYRNPPYHNWMHAYSVGHFCYLLVKNLQLQNFLDDIEIFGLFVSCLCHDIDHRGTNNSFQVASQSILAALYSSEGSVMERHHFAQTMCILNTDGCNIFENLSSRDYQHVLDIVRDVILATDLAHHLRILKSLEAMAKEGYNKSSIKCHKLLLCLLMTACDLSDQTKKWENTKHIAALVYKEFFSQGDLEKAIGKEPIEMMDRERAKIPDLQISFLQHIAAPVYNLLSDLFPAAEPVSRAVKENCAHWEKIANKVKLRRGGSCAKMSIEQILALEVEDETDASKTHDKDNQQQSEVSENGCTLPVTLQDADHNHTEQVGQG